MIMTNTPIEYQTISKTIKLLQDYMTAQTQAQKDEILERLKFNQIAYNQITHKKMDPSELITKLEKALTVIKYKPKNMPITHLATDTDLEYIGGQFNTFDSKLSKMFKNKEKPENIKQEFINATANIHTLAKGFSADWVRRLKKHPDLVTATKNADESNAIAAYGKLFEALATDFSKEYENIQIYPQVITDWAKSEYRPNQEAWDITDGMHHMAYGLLLDTEMSAEEQEKLRENYNKNPYDFKLSFVIINITNIRKKSAPNDFFYQMVCMFAHEIHHVLDAQLPREGALGPQIELIDRKTYTPPEQSQKQYRASATERSSNAIQTELFKQLKQMNF